MAVSVHGSQFQWKRPKRSIFAEMKSPHMHEGGTSEISGRSGNAMHANKQLLQGSDKRWLKRAEMVRDAGVGRTLLLNSDLKF